MLNNPERIFISYSWDSVEHQDWVLNLVRRLRAEGYDANYDRGITTNTVNLNQMMVEHMRDDDYIIIILTEKYADKANGFIGGVGFETILSMPIIQQNLEKLIIILRQPALHQKAIPFHLQGINYIDFSDDHDFSEKFEELMYRIQKVPMFELGPIGEKKSRIPKGANNKDVSLLDGIKIPNLNPPTDLEKNTFLEKNYKLITNSLDGLLNNIHKKNPNFNYQKEHVTNNKIVYSLYLNGQNMINMKIWIGGFFSSSKQIQFLVDRYIDSNNDNSMNGYVEIKIDQDYLMSLSMPMNGFNTKKLQYDDVVKVIYENHIFPYLK